ncbi:MAG: hypothetical protein CL774_01240 [Chloroflexi bacterium]|nr:hypothetical protein [Chloroflexota bacterium]|tara:strand:- start:5662 stop:6531 length:870 start_codon:yes stop_codon:yes gene_type:complete
MINDLLDSVGMKTMTKLLENKVAMITGGASGIGEGVTKVLSEKGASVAICDVNENAAKILAKKINSSGGNAISGYVDVVDKKSIDDFVSYIISEFGNLNICVPNAGVIGSKDFSSRKDYNDSDWEMTIDVNLIGVKNTVDSVKDNFISSKEGKIVIISSHGGRKPRGIGEKDRGNVQHPYLVSKAAVIQYMHLLAIELGPYNINVNAVCPGRIWTPIYEAIALNHKEVNSDYANMTNYEIFIDQIKKVMPLGRPQTPEDIGNAVSFLASPDSSEITGQALNVNGGASMN